MLIILGKILLVTLKVRVLANPNFYFSHESRTDGTAGYSRWNYNGVNWNSQPIELGLVLFKIGTANAILIFCIGTN
jgi:hypothetical protein